MGRGRQRQKEGERNKDRERENEIDREKERAPSLPPFDETTLRRGTSKNEALILTD